MTIPRQVMDVLPRSMKPHSNNLLMLKEVTKLLIGFFRAQMECYKRIKNTHIHQVSSDIILWRQVSDAGKTKFPDSANYLQIFAY